MELKVIEFPNENILPIGYNVTIACISNASNVNGLDDLPYWIHFYRNSIIRKLHDCGGRDGSVDSRVSKVCELFIQNATKENSANYSCWAYTQRTCAFRKIEVQFRGTFKSLSILFVEILLIQKTGSRLYSSVNIRIQNYANVWDATLKFPQVTGTVIRDLFASL